MLARALLAYGARRDAEITGGDHSNYSQLRPIDLAISDEMNALLDEPGDGE